jgi:pyruvate dehydrogenase E2 component (dihydrolipoamide acetyltransferase)
MTESGDDATDGGADRGARSAPVERNVAEERSLSPMRRTIAERLGESYRNAVHVTLSRDLDAEALLEATRRAGDATDAGVSLLDVLLLAVSATLDEHPAFNATFEDGTHRTYEEHNLAVAVAIDAGLVTPVVADVGSKSLESVARERRRLTERVQAGDYSMSDLRGSTFTVSNLGPLGVDSFTPIIDPPKVAILGVGRTRERARAGADGGPSVEFHRELTVDLSIDHRVVDGADGARFLGTLAGHVEDADSLLDGRLAG